MIMELDCENIEIDVIKEFRRVILALTTNGLENAKLFLNKLLIFDILVLDIIFIRNFIETNIFTKFMIPNYKI